MCERVCSKRTQKLIWIFKQCESRTLEKDCRAAAYMFPVYMDCLWPHSIDICILEIWNCSQHNYTRGEVASMKERRGGRWERMASDQLNKIFCVPYIHYNILTHQIDYFYIFSMRPRDSPWRYRSRHSTKWLVTSGSVLCKYKVSYDRSRHTHTHTHTLACTHTSMLTVEINKWTSAVPLHP